MCGRVLSQHGDVDGEVRCAIGEGDAFEQGRVRVEHRRRDRRIVGVYGLLERGDVLMCGPRFEEDFGRAAPDHDETIDGVVLGELVDAFTDALEHLALGPNADHVGTVETLDVERIERSFHGLHRSQRFGDGLEVTRLENTRTRRGNVRIVGERIP